ncbi:MAG: PIN domain-containing protein [Candidatus Daviesbacteria bacterium]|nr:PIN domain-containing protein [Candidatus Daviesbacteria bacterium]
MAGRRSNLKLAFLDSSVLFSAVNSPTGGSAKLFTIKRLKLCTSTLVLTETERNIRKKLEFYHLERFFILVEKLTIISAVPTKKQISQAEKIIVQKDAAILFSAKSSKSDFIFTLDQKHFLTTEVAKFTHPTKVLTPKMFFQKVKSENN